MAQIPVPTATPDAPDPFGDDPQPAPAGSQPASEARHHATVRRAIVQPVSVNDSEP